MITIIEQVLPADLLAEINQLIDQGAFVDGRETAGWAAQQVKNNLQWLAPEELMGRVDGALTQALIARPEFASTAYPKNLQPFLISESLDEGGYGTHVDDALMGHEGISRTDLSCTVFLSDPDTYQGGDLVMELGGTELRYRLPAGTAIVYPSTTLHRVEPVEDGIRRVAVTWIESYVRDAAQREILKDLDSARREVMQSAGKTAAFDNISKAHANLLRRWAET